MTEIRIYCEGHKTLKSGFDAFFSALIEQARNRRIQIKVLPSGSGEATCRDFGISLRKNKTAWNILLIDSEGPLAKDRSARLCKTKKWSTNQSNSVHWMVQMMEAWFHADVDALAAFYEEGFNKRKLKAYANVELIPKEDLENGLSAATRNSKRGNYYRNKTLHSAELLLRISPAKVREAAPNCRRLFDTILAKLAQ